MSEEGIALAQELADSSPDVLFTDDFRVLEDTEDFREFADELDFYYYGYDDIENVAKILIEAGYDDILDLEYMDEEERNELLVSLDLDPEDFSF